MKLYKVTYFKGYLGDIAPVMEKIFSEELIEGNSIEEITSIVAKSITSKLFRIIGYSDNHHTIDCGKSSFIDIDQIA